MAGTGGLLVAAAAKYNEVSEGQSGIQRLKPHIYFNAGRVISYTLLGGAIGALGSALTLSPGINGGSDQSRRAAVMILLGLQMLKLLTVAHPLHPDTSMPESLFAPDPRFGRARDQGAGAFVLGAATIPSCPAALPRRCSSMCWPRPALRPAR